ncbi:unnamed protein product, partial [Didymodactylos carnosus]
MFGMTEVSISNPKSFGTIVPSGSTGIQCLEYYYFSFGSYGQETTVILESSGINNV